MLLKPPIHLQPSKDDEPLDEEENEPADARASEELPDEHLPHVGMEDDEVEFLNVPYSTRAPGDWVSSGTLDHEYAQFAEKHGLRRLRYFPSWGEAETWARGFFGERFKGRVFDAFNSGCPYWAFIIRGPRGAIASGQ